jgi:hypothetical protein
MIGPRLYHCLPTVGVAGPQITGQATRLAADAVAYKVLANALDVAPNESVASRFGRGSPTCGKSMMAISPAQYGTLEADRSPWTTGWRA